MILFFRFFCLEVLEPGYVSGMNHAVTLTHKQEVFFKSKRQRYSRTQGQNYPVLSSSASSYCSVFHVNTETKMVKYF